MSTKNAGPASQLPVRPGEDPWTKDEVAEQRQMLVDEVERLDRKVAATEEELADLLRGGTDLYRAQVVATDGDAAACS